jgi:hypothetical protein
VRSCHWHTLDYSSGDLRAYLSARTWLLAPAGAGNGLFTGRPFFKNDLITEYCGPIIDHQKALKLRKRGRATHVRVLNSQWLYIDGLKQPMAGQGGASFANDARTASAYNAVFVQR